jgi:hypothetical protein
MFWSQSGPGRGQRLAIVRNARRGSEHGLSPSPNHEIGRGRPQLDHTDAAEHAPLDLDDLAVFSWSAVRWIPTGASVTGVAHQGDQAWQRRAGAEHASGMEAQAAVHRPAAW